MLMRKYAIIFLLLCLYGLARGQTTDYTGYYWFDNLQGKPTESPMLQGSFDVDVSFLGDGLHTFHYVVVKKDGSISQPSMNYFVKTTAEATSIDGYYWFDDEIEPHKSHTLNGMFEVDASDLSDGFHQFSYIATQNNGGLSRPTSCYFLKMAQIAEDDSLTCICSVDGQLRHIEKLSQEGGVIHWNLDMQDLTDGIHQIQLQAVTKSGALSSNFSSYFMRITSNEELVNMRCVYAIDNESFYTNSNVVSSNGSYHFDLDLSELDDGLHYISVLLHNDRGTISKVQTRFFVKVPLGGNGIDHYQYWLNEDDISQAKTITLPEKVNPLQLMSLLPVESRALRSTLFHFDTSSGKPMVYAKNTIHLRFYDAAMRFTDVAKDYADYSIAQEVSVIKTLESGLRETTDWPGENEIKWYQVTAERGDSLRFKLDHAATLQIFAPSGKEVYNVSGAESVSWGGLHTAESGTFYIALHDVTATQGEDITIDYEHIDKYAVLRQDVAVVGNGGCSTITFEGNGFKDLYAVDLYTEQGDSIKHIYIGHESDATTSVVFDFSGTTLGVYHANFHFTDEDKVFTNLVTVEEARDIELATTVTYPSTFLRGTSTAYTIKITNKGNMTSYRTPIYIYIATKTPNGISRVKISGLELDGVFDGVNMDGLPNSDRKQLKSIADEIGDTHYFIQLAKYDETTGDSIYVMSGYFFADISPRAAKTATVTLTTQNQVELWCTVPFTNSPLLADAIHNDVSFSRRISREEYCCIRERVECFVNLVATGVGLANKLVSVAPGTPLKEILGIADCVADAVSTVATAVGEVMCDNPNYVEMTLWEKVKALKKGISIIRVISKCASDLLPVGNLKNFLEAIKGITGNDFFTALGVYDLGFNCTSAFTSKNPNCPPNPEYDGGSSIPVNSLDPNDIYGYIAGSGNHSIRDGLTDVYYRIEFENDPTFATASAHEIVVTDTLDATKFDLSTFAPTKVKIGEKSAELNGYKNFVTTIDMRPEINAIAQVESTFDQQKGIAKWHITSLDPMTMEPTNDVMQGVLPVNYNGNGIGELSYDISLKQDLAHGTEVNNRAAIVFDQNDVIMTPTWTNIIDRIAPESHVSDVKMLNDTTVAVSIAATDELSGPWRYNVYVQYGDGAWFLGAENVPIDKAANVKVFEGIDHGFYTVVTDSAGNVEQKAAAREYTFEVFAPQTETTTKLQLAEGWNWMSQNQNTALSAEVMKPKALRIKSQTEELYKDARFGWTGDLDELLPTQMYKVQMGEAAEVQLGGLLFNAAFRSIPLREGWNWIGYPVAKTMTPAEALAKFEAEEDDAIIGRDGLITYNDGQWMGTLTEMQPGQGYMFRSVSDKSLFLNATAQSSSRRVGGVLSIEKPEYPDNWTVDKRKYPNVMGIVAELYQDEKPVSDCGEWLLGAFCGDECRGLAQTVGHQLMMNVYGQGGEKITFLVMHRESGEILGTSESEEFRSGLLGSVRQPYILNIGVPTGIVSIDTGKFGKDNPVYDLQGRKVDGAESQKGVYIVTDGKNGETQKVVRR